MYNNIIIKQNIIIGLNRKRERLRLLSPSNFNNNNANDRNVNTHGNANNNNVNNANGVRAVVTLSADAEVLEGTGTYADPFVVGEKISRSNQLLDLL